MNGAGGVFAKLHIASSDRQAVSGKTEERNSARSSQRVGDPVGRGFEQGQAELAGAELDTDGIRPAKAHPDETAHATGSDGEFRNAAGDRRIRERECGGADFGEIWKAQAEVCQREGKLTAGDVVAAARHADRGI